MSRTVRVLVGVCCACISLTAVSARAEMAPSAAVDMIPPLPSSPSALNCPAINLDPASRKPLQEIFQTEMQASAMAMQQVMMTNMSGPVSDAQGAAIEAANDQSLGHCGGDEIGGLTATREIEARVEHDLQVISDAHAKAIQACPKPGGFIDEACAKAARAASRPKVAALMARYLEDTTLVLAKSAATIRECAVRREKIVASLKANKITGAFAMMGMQYSMQSWQLALGLLEARKTLCDGIARMSATFREP